MSKGKNGLAGKSPIVGRVLKPLTYTIVREVPVAEYLEAEGLQGVSFPPVGSVMKLEPWGDTLYTDAATGLVYHIGAMRKLAQRGYLDGDKGDPPKDKSQE